MYFLTSKFQPIATNQHCSILKQVALLLQRGGGAMLCLSVVRFNSVILPLESSHCYLGFRFTTTIKCCSVVFRVTFRLLVINTSSSSPVKNKRCRVPATIVSSTRHGSSQLSVLHLAVEAFIACDGARYWLRSRFLPTPPAFDAPVRRFPSQYRHDVWRIKTRMV